MDSTVTAFIAKNKWQAEMELLRSMVLDCQLEETVKWKVPCYMYRNGNVVLIHGFKSYCALLFFKGSLLRSHPELLIQQTENVQSGRQIRFTSMAEIEANKAAITACLYEAIEVEKSGLKVDLKPMEAYEKPVELEQKLQADNAFKTAFEALTPGRQRAYILHFSGSQQAKTRQARIDKYTSRILNGKGITDCVCGLSKRMPNCDGSHKFAQNIAD